MRPLPEKYPKNNASARTGSRTSPFGNSVSIRFDSQMQRFREGYSANLFMTPKTAPFTTLGRRVNNQERYGQEADNRELIVSINNDEGVSVDSDFQEDTHSLGRWLVWMGERL